MAVVRQAATGYWTSSCLVLVRDVHTRKVVERLLDECRMGQVTYVDDLDQAMLHFCSNQKVDMVLCDAMEFAEDHLALTTFVRWSDHSKDKTIPVVVLSNVWTAKSIAAAREAGTTALMIMPMAFHALFRRFMSAQLSDRAFIQSEYYRGPDRRLKSNPAFAGPYRRVKDRQILKDPDYVEPPKQKPVPPVPPPAKMEAVLSATNQAELFKTLKDRT